MTGFFSAGLFDTIPDSVASRNDDDDSTTSATASAGLVIQMNGSFDAIGARISTNTSGVTRAYLYNDSDLADETRDSLIADIDISGLSAGDAFNFTDVNLVKDNYYWIVLDAEGSTYTRGFNISPGLPVQTTDIDIVEGAFDGSTVSTASNVNDVGDVGFN